MELSCLNSHPSNPSYFPLCRLWLSGWLHGHSYFLLAPGEHIAMLFPWGPRPIAGSSSSLLEEKKKKETFTFWPRCTAKGILVPGPGTEPALLPLEVQSPNHWAAGGAPLWQSCLWSHSQLRGLELVLPLGLSLLFL